MEISTAIIFLIVLLVLIFGIIIGVKFSKLFKRDTNISITNMVKEILPTSEYATLTYFYSDVITHSDVSKFNIPLIGSADIPFTGKKAIYTIDGTIKLGFYGKKIEIENSYSNIIVHMPKIRLLSHEIYPETFRLYDEQTGLFNNYSLKDANEIQRHQKVGREKKINEDSGLFTLARESAEQQFRVLLENMPGIKDKYKIVFEWD